MAKRRKRRSSKDLMGRAMKDIRTLHRAHLKEISAILSNTLGFPVRVSLVPVAEVLRVPKKLKKKKPSRRTAHVAGYGTDQGVPAEVEPRTLPSDDVGF